MESKDLSCNETKEILEKINLIFEKIDKVLEEKRTCGYQSDDTKELNEALSKAHSEYPPIQAKNVNGYWGDKYGDFDCIMLIIRPILANHGLTLTQRTILTDDGSSYLQTRLWHATGQWIETRTKILPTKNDIHTFGSTQEYMKKSEAMSLLNITIQDNPADDDGELQQASAKEIFAKGTALNSNYNKKLDSRDIITKEQLSELEYELQGFDDIAEEMLTTLRIQSLADLPQSRYMKSLERIRKIKKIRNENNIG